MKFSYYLIALLFSCSLVFSGCKKGKNKPDASFTVNYVAHGGVYVERTAPGNEFCTWEFSGEGLSLENITLSGTQKGTFYYRNNGTYTIKMTIEDIESGKKDTKEQTITITDVPTKVKLTYMKINSFNPLNPDGNPWDNDATGPDIYFQYFETGTTGMLNTLSDLYPNISTSQLPIVFTVPSTEFLLANQSTVQLFFADDNYTNAFNATSIDFIEFTPGALFAIYPSTYSSKDINGNTTFEVGLEWLP